MVNIWHSTFPHLLFLLNIMNRNVSAKSRWISLMTFFIWMFCLTYIIIASCFQLLSTFFWWLITWEQAPSICATKKNLFSVHWHFENRKIMWWWMTTTTFSSLINVDPCLFFFRKCPPFTNIVTRSPFKFVHPPHLTLLNIIVYPNINECILYNST